jgi:hypothetical protein
MHKGKGIIFVGCSFTWGGGLEYYPPFKDIPNPYAFQYDEKNTTFAIMNFIKANRFSRLVANHFGMWEANRLNCGGSDDGSISQVKMMLGLGEYTPDGIYSKQFENIKTQRYSADEIDCVVFQLTDPFRNYLIDINGEKLVINIAQIRQRNTNEFNRNNINKFKDTLDDETFNKFFKFYTDNFNSWEEMEDYFILENLKGVIELFKEVESLGIKCKLWSWHNEYVPFIKKHEYLSSKFIKLKYEDTEFDCLYDLMKKHPKFKISTSGFLVNGKPVPDDHQTPECHKVIADSIINSIENDAIDITIR